jgi:integrase
VEHDHLETICRNLPVDEADLVRFCYITGWRWQSEAAPLTWPQVDFAAGFVRLEPGTTKNTEGREFPLIPELRELLERRLALTRRMERAQVRVIPWVFHRRGRPIRSLRRSWLTATEAAGRPGVVLHDLRRSAVRNLERAGVSRSVAMKITGHRTEAVYRRYAIVATSDLREAGVKLAALGDNFRSVWLQRQVERRANSENLVGRDGIEPPTPGFSVLCSTN